MNVKITFYMFLFLMINSKRPVIWNINILIFCGGKCVGGLLLVRMLKYVEEYLGILRYWFSLLTLQECCSTLLTVFPVFLYSLRH